MRNLFSLLALTIFTSVNVYAAQLEIGYGASVPADPSNQTLISKKGPSRSNGGEHILVKFSAPKTVTDIKLTGFSASKKGSVVVHSATAMTGATKTSLDGLSVFKKVTAGNPVNYKEQVQLSDTLFVEVQPNAKIGQLDIIVEGFANDDDSLLLQVTTAEALPVEEFMASRSSSSEVFGGMINELNFAKFTSAELVSLMTRAANPAAQDLAGRTYLCTSYTKLNGTELNYKKRIYYMAGANLMSDSDIEGQGQVWSPSAIGQQMPIENFNGCGHYKTTNVLRMTGAGNLVSEVVLELQPYINLCAGAGYDPASVAAVEANSTFPSILDAAHVVNNYEFCHPAN